jgi:hypothetical protein
VRRFSDAVIEEHDSYVKKFNKELDRLEKITKQIKESNISRALETSLDYIIGIEEQNSNYNGRLHIPRRRSTKLESQG